MWLIKLMQAIAEVSEIDRQTGKWIGWAVIIFLIILVAMLTFSLITG